jgi:hypothetical protein
MGNNNNNQNLILYECDCGTSDTAGYCSICHKARERRVNMEILKEIENSVNIKNEFELPRELEQLATFYYRIALRGHLQKLQLAADKPTIERLDTIIDQLSRKLEIETARIESPVEMQIKKDTVVQALNSLKLFSGDLIEIKKMQLYAQIRAIDANTNLMLFKEAKEKKIRKEGNQ